MTIRVELNAEIEAQLKINCILNRIIVFPSSEFFPLQCRSHLAALFLYADEKNGKTEIPVICWQAPERLPNPASNTLLRNLW
jgi:hypothetical protein